MGTGDAPLIPFLPLAHGTLTSADASISNAWPWPTDSGPAIPSADPSGAGQGDRGIIDFIDGRTLQELQDSFTALTGFPATILNADGRAVTHRTDPTAQRESDRVLQWLMADEMAKVDKGKPLVAPIVVDGRELGSIRIEPAATGGPAGDGNEPNLAAAVQFLYLLANSIARLCYQEHQLRHRVEELSTLYTFSTVLAGKSKLQEVLDSACRGMAQALGVKAVAIRLLDRDSSELIVKSVYNLSDVFLNKGPILLSASAISRQALGDGITYVAEVATDPRVIYPDDAQREGIVSELAAGIVYRGRPIGVVTLFTAEPRAFTRYETDLVRAMSQLLAAAIDGARLQNKQAESDAVQRQVRLAADVQKRMLPQKLPLLAGFELAARTVSSFELGGDFYDFIDLAQENLGIAVADVSGKGIAASLLMASVRSSLRAYAQDMYNMDEIVSRLNVALCRDTQINEFVTLFYAVLNPTARRLTYCNAGHEPPLLLRQGKFIRLEAGGMVVGIDPEQKYDKGILDLQSGDRLLMFTDGLMDAMAFSGQRFGRKRIMRAMLQSSGQTAQEMLDHVLWEMRRFAGLNQRTDDTTLVVLHCR